MEDLRIIKIIRSIDYMSFEDKLRLLYCIIDTSMSKVKVDKKKIVPILEKMCKVVNGGRIVNFAVFKNVMLITSQIVVMNEKEQNLIALYIYKKITNKVG